MRNLDSWIKRGGCSAPAVLQSNTAERLPSSEAAKHPRGFRSPGHYRTEELIEEVRMTRVPWCRADRGFYSPAARLSAYKRVADAMNRRFPELRPWHHVEVKQHFRVLAQYQYACLKEHGPGGKPHSSTCRLAQMSFMNADLLSITDWYTFIALL